MKRFNLEISNRYLYLNDVFSNNKDNYIKFLSRIIQTRTTPEGSVIFKDGYYVGKTIPSDSIDTLLKNKQDAFNKLDANDWVENGVVKEIDYKINIHGCRSKNFNEILDKPIIIGIGCSITYGVGLRQEQTWLHNLAEKLNCEYVNLSMPGCSLAITSLFCCEYVLKIFKNVKAVFVFVPPPNRLELLSYTDIGESLNPIEEQDIHVEDFLVDLEQARDENRKFNNIEKKILRSLDHTTFLKTLKDQKMIEYKCQNLNIPYYSLDSSTFIVPTDLPKYKKARDLLHDGPQYHEDITNDFYKMYMTDK